MEKNEPVVVFTTRSDIEASVVMALLDSRGIQSFRRSGNPQAIWPMAVNPLDDIRIAVAADAADEARRIIDSHREDVGSRVVRLRDEFDELERRIAYRFTDRGLLEHALTHKSRAAEDASTIDTAEDSYRFEQKVRKLLTRSAGKKGGSLQHFRDGIIKWARIT